MRRIALLVLAAVLAGCAAAPNPKLEQARTAVKKLDADADVNRNAPVAVAEAEEALQSAQQAQERAEVSHRAELALRRVEIARAKARQRAAEKRAEQADERAQSLQLEAREQEAEQALKKAAEAERRAEQLRAEAVAERKRAEAAQSRLKEVQQQLAELKPKLTERGLVLTLGEVLFDFDSAHLKPYTQRIMDRLAAFLNEHKSHTLVVEGHTDSVGSAEYNMKLSRARAQSVTDALLDRGVDASRMQTRGLGESHPIASNDTAAGRRQNRRVEVVINQPGL